MSTLVLDPAVQALERRYRAFFSPGPGGAVRPSVPRAAARRTASDRESGMRLDRNQSYRVVLEKPA
jgi:hypothetical protein